MKKQVNFRFLQLFKSSAPSYGEYKRSIIAFDGHPYMPSNSISSSMIRCIIRASSKKVAPAKKAPQRYKAS